MSAASHTEEAFESAVEAALISTGWASRPASSYDAGSGFLIEDLIGFLAESQPQAWARLVKIHGGSPELSGQRIVRRIASLVDRHGTVHCLRHGVSDNGIDLRLAFFRPATRMSSESLVQYGRNRLSVVRQVHYDGGRPSIDLVLFVNGLPVATAELKNPLTGQSVSHAIAQYRQDRDPGALLFARRAVIHFAVDPDQVYMTTRLAGAETRFLPFNRGSRPDGTGGAGNPPSPSGHRTAYLWNEVWNPDAWLEILHSFVHVAPASSETEADEVIFPRYHQWDVVRRATAHALSHGAGHNYLIQHSAGSGKSNEIAWLAHSLSRLHDASDDLVFNKTIIITDRVVLDRQLQEQVFQFEQQRGVVVRIDRDSAQLAEALVNESSKIVVTTIQKFPFVLSQIRDGDDKVIGRRRYAVIVDEAHSSQTGESSRALKALLGDDGRPPDDSGSDADEDGAGDIAAALVAALEERAASRGHQPNLSFFAFTATPKARTLELFGEKDDEGTFRPFHLYSMRQAIEEGFILDVLRAYTTYDVFYRLSARAGAEEKEYERGKLSSALARHVRLHPHAIAQKVAIIVEHHRLKVAPNLQGNAKSMVVTSSRLDAVRYKLAVDMYLAAQGYDDLKALVAFSGSVKDPDTGEEFTEAGMNPRGKEIPARLKEPGFGLLIVAEKYQTGFDEPLLTAMYVDKRLKGVNAVQTLSRLNRIYPGKPDPFVLDFVNSTEEIRKAFESFYEATVAEPTDPNLLYDTLAALKTESDVLREDEVRAFTAAILDRGLDANNRREREAVHSALYAFTDMAVERFGDLDAEDQQQFRAVVERFVRLYAFLSQVIPYVSPEAEQYYLFTRVLSRRLETSEIGGIDVGDDVFLTHFRAEAQGTDSVDLRATNDPLVAFPPDGGRAQGPAPVALLTEMLQLFNERFGVDLSDEDALPLEHIKAKGLADTELRTIAAVNSFDQFELVYAERFMDHLLDADDAHGLVFRKLLDDEAFRAVVSRRMAEMVYAELRSDPAG